MSVVMLALSGLGAYVFGVIAIRDRSRMSALACLACIAWIVLVLGGAR